MSDGPSERRAAVKDLPVGAEFFHERRWQVVMQDGYTVARAVNPPGAVRRYYDSVTARKAGEFSREVSVELLAGRSTHRTEETG